MPGSKVFPLAFCPHPKSLSSSCSRLISKPWCKILEVTLTYSSGRRGMLKIVMRSANASETRETGSKSPTSKTGLTRHAVALLALVSEPLPRFATNCHEECWLNTSRPARYFFCLARASASAMAIVPVGCA